MKTWTEYSIESVVKMHNPPHFYTNNIHCLKNAQPALSCKLKYTNSLFDKRNESINYEDFDKLINENDNRY